MQALTRWSLRAPTIALAAIVVATAGLGAGLLQLRTDVGYRAFLGAEHPTVRTFDAFLERFGGGLPVAVAWSCAETPLCESVFDSPSLRMAHAVATTLGAAHGVRRVESPATSALLVPTSEGFAVRHLVEGGLPAPDRGALAARALLDPLWVGGLVSEDGQVGAILLELTSSDSETSIGVFHELGRALAPFRDRGFRYHLVGGPVDFVVAAAELEAATARLIPVVVLAISVVVWLLVRSALAVAFTLGAMGVAVLWTLGLLGWLGWPQSTLTQTLPPLVLVVGACDGIHVLSRYAAETAARGGSSRASRERALLRVASDVGAPCLITSATTAGGFASFATSELESFVRFGIAAALGVLAALVLTFTLLPILLARLPEHRLPAPSATALWDRSLAGLVRFAERRALAILTAMAVLGIACGAGATRLRVDVSFEDLYGEESQVVRWVRFVEAHLRKPETLELEIALPEGQRVVAPEVVSEIQAMAAHFPVVEGLGRVHSVVEPLSWIHRLLNDDDPAYQRPAETLRGNAQLLTLLAIDDPGRLDPWITLDQRRARVSIEARKVPQDRLRAMIESTRAYLAELPGAWRITITGAAAVIHDMVEEIKRTQLTSFVTAVFVVLAMVGIFFRSPGWALLAMIPTGLPVVLTLGSMGFFGVPLDVGTAMVAAVVIGIAIDDTIHLLSQYRRRRAAGLDVSTGIGEAVRHVGRALVTTSIALALGFFSLLVSPWESVANFGLVAGTAIMAALVADLVVLPALLFAGGRARRRAGLGDATAPARTRRDHGRARHG